MCVDQVSSTSRLNQPVVIFGGFTAAAMRTSGGTFRELLAALAANDECHIYILSFAKDGSDHWNAQRDRRLEGVGPWVAT